MRVLACLLVSLVLVPPLRAETARAPTGCTMLAMLVFENCSVAMVSSCETMPRTHRVYEYYLDGEVSSRSVNEDGAFLLAAATKNLYRTFNFSSGLLKKLLTKGEGSEIRQNFTAATRRGAGTERRQGVMTARHMGFDAYMLGGAEVSVLRLEVDGDLNDGTKVRSTRLLDLETGILLVLSGTETPPGGVVRRFDHRTVVRLFPGDPGFAEVTEPPHQACGAPN